MKNKAQCEESRIHGPHPWGTADDVKHCIGVYKDIPKDILVTDVLVIQRVQRPYPLSDVELVAELEKNRSLDEILNDLASELPYIPNDKIIHTRIVKVRDRSNESRESE